MRAAPPVTVVTSTYNWPSALAQAIPTALSQNFGDFEYLIFGDGCTDETEDIVRSFDDPRIVWHNLPENLGNQADVNRIALEVARGDMVAYLNHDDLWFDDHLQVLLPLCRDHDFDIASSLSLVVAPSPHTYRGINGLPQMKGGGAFLYVPFTSGVLHRLEAARQCGSWQPWRQSREVPTIDFFNRLLGLRGRVGISAHVTVVKFHSADRLGSYQSRTANEQAAWALKMREDPLLRYRETMAAIMGTALGEAEPRVVMPVAPSAAQIPGAQIEVWRRQRGLAPMVDIGPHGVAAAAPRMPSFVRRDDFGWAYLDPKSQ